ncbi:MAG: caspase family protein [Desulfobacterales bacterium]|nr:caspase family protein [Desulfobacterales bacterium]
MKRILGLISILSVLILLAGCGTALTQAAKEGDIAAIQKLLDQGANINEGGSMGGIMAGSPLSYAAYHCRIEAVKYLIHKGADINNATGYTDYGYGGGGLRPLHMAARSGCTEAIKLLLDAGADIDVRANEGWGAALAIAAYKGHIKSVKYLLERGADVDDASQVLKALEREKLTSTGGKEGLALLQKFEKQMAVKPREEKSVLTVIKSDIDTVPALKADPRPDDLAVVIGIENYKGLPKSDYSKSDAGTVKDYLKALGFKERNIEFITDADATKSSIEKSLEAWLPNRIKKDSRVFIYYSGHGAPEPKTGDAYLVPYDGDPNYLEVTGYSLKRLYDNLGKLQVAEITVVLDSCFSGAGGRSVLAQGARPLVMMADIKTIPSNMAILSATQGFQISTSSPEKGHGVFTYYFLKALKDGKKTIAEIYEYIKPLVEDEAKALNVQQSPSISPDAEKIKGRFGLRK